MRRNIFLRFSTFFSFIFMQILFFSCSYGTNNLFYAGNNVNNREKEGIQDFGKPEYLGTSENYTIVILTDLHFGSKKGEEAPVEEFLTWMEKQKTENKLPKMCLVLGDDADHGYDEEMKIYKNFQDKIEAYGVPVFNTVGNHDLYNSGWENWIKYAGSGMVGQSASAYKFKTENYSYYTVDSGTTIIGSTQMESLEQKFSADNSPKIMFSHYPIYIDRFLFCMEDTTERNKMIDLLAKNNVKLYLAGHVHLFDEEDFGAFKSYALPSFRYQKQWTVISVDEKNADNPFKLEILN